MYYQADETGRIMATTEREEYAGEGYGQFDFPDDFDFGLQNEYRIVDGELVHDPPPIPVDQRIAELKSNLDSTDYVVIKLSEMKLSNQNTLSDEDTKRYSEIISNRQAWRDEINRLESEKENVE